MSKCNNCGIVFAIYGKRDADFCSKECEDSFKEDEEIQEGILNDRAYMDKAGL